MGQGLRRIDWVRVIGWIVLLVFCLGVMYVLLLAANSLV